ncbi:MAG: hypothetical protein RSD57_16710 [Comamonas sp.]
MRIQIQRVPLHQNAKVMAILLSISMVIFVIPFSLITMLVSPGPIRFQVVQMLPMLLMPLLYLIFSYVSMIIACAIYNALVSKTGPLEFEADVTRP